MKRSSSTKSKKPLVYIFLAIVVLVSVAIFAYTRSQSKRVASPVIPQQNQENSENTAKTTQPEDVSQASSPQTQKSVPTSPPPIPKQPSFTKSSGNNGAVPAGVSINFVCTAEPGVDCSIILVSNGKQTTVGPTKVSDNGRGQYFASFYWTSVKGSYKVTAEAKNIQGGVSSSIAQALEVQ